ncbi:MAG: hypothetical protein COS85_03965 [Armatimonadetes bacterium CG07_land_8_20_14_0_80_59_28]|nr:MAG: hypothetical protein COS85_03965 [Armatimonadetes bacterium CG07_land_8_20_14_0_80_59_28]
MLQEQHDTRFPFTRLTVFLGVLSLLLPSLLCIADSCPRVSNVTITSGSASNWSCTAFGLTYNTFVAGTYSCTIDDPCESPPVDPTTVSGTFSGYIVTWEEVNDEEQATFTATSACGDDVFTSKPNICCAQ